MAYSDHSHRTWSQRVKNLMAALDDLAFREGDRLDEIYTNQGGNVPDNPEWVDVDFATKAELMSAITTIRELQQFIDGSDRPAQADRRSRFAPFLQQ